MPDSVKTTNPKLSELNHFLIENNPFPVMLIDLQHGKIIQINLASQELFGYSEREFSELDPNHLTKRNQDPAVQWLPPAKESQQLDSFTNYYDHKGDKILVKEEWILLPDYSKQTYLLILKPHIEEDPSQTREAMKDEKSLLDSLINNLPDRIYFKNRKSQFIIANQAVANHIGVENSSALIGKSDSHFYPKEHAIIYYADEQSIMASGIPLLNYEEPARNPNGTIGWTLSSKIPIKNHVGDVIGLVGISRDITEIKQSQNDLIEAKEAAEQSSRLKDAFIANVSHEIRTPLNAILGFTSLMKDEYQESGEISSSDFFDVVESSGERLMRTVEMILNLSRIETGEFIVQIQNLMISSMIDTFNDDYLLPAQRKKLDLEFVITSTRTHLKTDEYAFMHSISNLIDNAIKYTHKGFIKVSFTDHSSGGLKIEVEDSGIGITKEYLPNLFEPYSQEEDGYARTFEGIGLGLSLTNKLVKLIDGELSVQSEKGKGTKFTVVISDFAPK